MLRLSKQGLEEAFNKSHFEGLSVTIQITLQMIFHVALRQAQCDRKIELPHPV